MAAEAEAAREARAKVCISTLVITFYILLFLQVIAAEGEQNASRVLRDAADILDESPASLQLRYLQTLNTIAGQNNHTYVFPLPMDLLFKLFSGQQKPAPV